LFLLLIVISLGTGAQAEGWKNWFVGANTGGGTHPMTVDTKSEAYEIRAGVNAVDRLGDNMRLGITCYAQKPGIHENESGSKIDQYMFLGGALFDVKAPINLTATFDDAETMEIGAFVFNQGALIGPLRPQFLASLTTHETIFISSRDRTVETRFSLENAATAIAGIRCKGESLE
jgi:hypothetical protein